MKKILTAAVAAALVLGDAVAANLEIGAHMGQSLATYSRTDDDNDDNDGISFFDHYLDASQTYSPITNMSLSQESAIGGGELRLKYTQKHLSQTYINGWLNFASPFGIPGTLTLRFGRFDAYPMVDIVTDANRGYHYGSYAVNPLINKAVGFDPYVMNYFVTRQGFVRSTHSRVHATYVDTLDAEQKPQELYEKARAAGGLTAYNWFFNDPNNMGMTLGYADTFRDVDTSFMVQYAPTDDLMFRFSAHTGSADAYGGSFSHDFYGEKTFTNWNAQVSYKVGDIANLGLTVKMSDQFSGAYTSGTGMWTSAGTDLEASLLASSTTLVDGLQLLVGYSFTGIYMGMKADTAEKADLNEMYMFHAIDLRAVYDIDEQLSVGLNGNLSMVNQSEYYKQKYKEDHNGDNPNDFLGFNAGVSASYALSDTLAIDFNAGFRCVNMNNKVTENKPDGTKEMKDDMLAACSFGVEPSIVFTFSKNAALSLGVNLLVQNLSSDDSHLFVGPQTNHMSNYYGTGCYPFTMTVTVPLYMFIRI